MDYLFLEEEYFFIKQISNKLGTLHKVPIVDNKPHGLCYNNCKQYINENSNSTIINGYYVIRNMKSGVYEFLRHSVIKEDTLFDITYPGASIDYLYFIETSSDFFDLNIKMFYLDEKFSTNYETLKKKGKYYIYGLFYRNSVPFHVGKESTNFNLDTNIKMKKKYKNLLDEMFAYDLEESVLKRLGLF